MQSVRWNQQKPVGEVLAEARAQGAEYMVAESGTNGIASANLEERSAEAADLIVLRRGEEAVRWKSLGDRLPKGLYFLAAYPADHSAVAISVSFAAANQNLVAKSRSLSELVARLATSANVSFVDGLIDGQNSAWKYPRLIQSSGGRRDAWATQLIDAIPVGKDRTSATAITALKAGLHLMNEDFDGSHSNSQSIEGMGANRTGDYWHAILHRREPDYGNAKYWFRHVGRHPAFVELARLVERRFSASAVPFAAKWRGTLLPQGKWDPFAFVDLCAIAETDADARALCEAIQYDEMLVLLESTAYDARDAGLS